MLKLLAGNDFRLGVNWYLAPEEIHKNDGRHVAYLLKKNEKNYRPCDPDLYDALRDLVHKHERNVHAVERNRILGQNVRYFSERIVQKHDREKWVSDGYRALRDCDLVFFDPDNGIAPEGRDKRGHDAPKFVFIDELKPYFAKQSVVIYQHATRQGTIVEQVERRFKELKRHVARRSMFALRFRRGTSRIFFVIPQHGEADTLLSRGRAIAKHECWGRRGKKGHFEFYSCN